MADNAVPDSRITNTNNNIHHVVLNVGEWIKDLNCHAAVCVYRVPKSLISANAEAFTPQFVGLGPYHHRRPEIYFNYLKAAAIMRVLKVNDLFNDTDVHVFTKLVQELNKSKLAPVIRDSYAYDSSVVFEDGALLYLMTVDALFLYDLLRNLEIKEEERDGIVTNFHLQDCILTGKQGMPLVNAAGAELSKDAIIRDIFMLENQVPTYMLTQIKTVTSMGTELHEDAGEYVGSKMLNFCRALCPFLKLERLPTASEAVEHVHLLDLMYHLSVSKPKPNESKPADSKESKADESKESKPDDSKPKADESKPKPDEQAQQGNTSSQKSPDKKSKPDDSKESKADESKEAKPDDSKPKADESKPKPDEQAQQGNTSSQKSPDKKDAKLTRTCCFKCCSALVFALLVCCVVVYIIVQIVKLILGLVWNMVKHILHLIPRALRYLKRQLVNLAEASHPTINCLYEKLAQTNISWLMPLTTLVGGLKKVCDYLREDSKKTDKDARSVVTIPSVSELHKAGIHFQPADCGISSIEFDEGIFSLPKIRVDVNSEVIIRNLMAYESLTKSNGLIFTRYVELMRAIIDTAKDVKLLVDKNIIETQLSDEQVAQLFNGMSKSIRPTNTAALDDVIKNVNKKFDSSRKPPTFMTKYVFPSAGTFLTIVVALALLAITAMQTYCSLFSCSRNSKFGNLPEDGYDYRNNYFISSM